MAVQTYTATGLADFKAVATSRVSAIYDRSVWTWTTGNFTGQADDLNVIKADSTALSAGAWVRQAAGTLPFRQNASGAVTRSTGGKIAEVVSITDFGASTSLADNALQVQAAIDAVYAIGGGTVVVPAGKFDHANAIRLKERVRLVGVGYSSQLHSTNTARLDGVVADGQDTNTRIKGLALADLRLTSTFDKTNRVPTGNAIRWQFVSDSSITNVWTYGWSDSGISLGSGPIDVSVAL